MTSAHVRHLLFVALVSPLPLLASLDAERAIAQGGTAGQNADSADSAGTSEALASVFVRRTTVPWEVEQQKGEDAWTGNNFPEKDAPRFRREQPQPGDFALYYVSHTHEMIYDLARTRVNFGEYLMLEYVYPTGRFALDPTDDTTAIRARIYGVTRNRPDEAGRWPAIAFRGLVTDAAGGEFPFFAPPRELASFADNALSLSDVAYFRDYQKFAAETSDKGNRSRDDRLAWTRLGKHPTLGQLWRFRWNYDDMSNPGAGIETVCVSENVPVRGLVFAKDDYSSSSGVNNHLHTIQLVNFGRLSEAQVQAVTSSDDVMPREKELFEQLAAKLSPREKPAE